MIKIISDSTSDLSRELLEKYNISVLPLNIHLGEQEYRDGINITPNELYKWSDENKTTPKTSAPSMADAMDLLRPYVETGTDVICFCISESMSTSANVVRLAAEELEAEHLVHVINSENLSTGIGLLVLKSAIMVEQGKSVKDILTAIEETKPLVRASFVVDTLTYLHRGGRCSSVAALVGGVLKLKPCIKVKDGAMGVDKKYRGKIDKVIINYVHDLENELKNAEEEMVFITHSGCDESTIRLVESYLKELDVFKNIYITRAGGVISSHCGPGTLGVLFIAKQ